MIGKEKIQDKYPNLMKGMMAVVSTGDAKKSFDSVDMQESNVFPAQEIIFRFEFYILKKIFLLKKDFNFFPLTTSHATELEKILTNF